MEHCCDLVTVMVVITMAETTIYARATASQAMKCISATPVIVVSPARIAVKMTEPKPILVLSNGEPDICFCQNSRSRTEYALPSHQCPYYADEEPSNDNYCSCCALCTEECREEKEGNV